VDGIDLGKVIGSTLAAVLLLLIIFLGKWLWDIGKKAGEKGLEVGKQVIDQAKDRMDGIPDGGGRYDDLYATAYEEMKSANMDSASWAKAFAHASGDQDKAKALYVRYRVEQLKREKAV